MAFHAARGTAVLLSGMIAGCAVIGGIMASPATTDPAKVEGGSFKVDANHTEVGFGVSHFGFSTYSGNFGGVSGTLQLDPKTASASAVEVHIPVGSLYVPSAPLAGELKSAGWLDAEKYPEMVFKSTSVKQTGPAEAEVTGDLQLHGVTKPVTLRVKLHGAGKNMLSGKYTVGFDGTAQIKRSDFGVKKYLPMIGDDIDVRIAAAFERS